MEYYLWTQGGQQGPFTREELETMYRTGQLVEPELQYTTDGGETWFPMGQLFAPGPRRGAVGIGPSGSPASSKGSVGNLIPEATTAVGASKDMAGMSKSGRIRPHPISPRDGLGPLDIGARHGSESAPGAAGGGETGGAGAGRSERPVKPKGPQHRTQRIEPSDSYVRIKDPIKPLVAYRIMRDGQESGPFEEPFLRRWVETGALEKDTPTRRDGTRDWEPLWHLLKMTPPGPVEVEVAQGRQAMRMLVWMGRALAIVGVALLAWGMYLPIMRALPVTAVFVALRQESEMTLWAIQPAIVWELAAFGLLALLAALYGSYRWLWVSWLGLAAGLGWMIWQMREHQVALRTLIGTPDPIRNPLKHKILHEMGTIPAVEYGFVFLVVGITLVAVSALVLQISEMRRRRV